MTLPMRQVCRCASLDIRQPSVDRLRSLHFSASSAPPRETLATLDAKVR